jgi:hypothetical protein
MKHAQKKPENPFLNIIFNIALPVYVLNKAAKHLGVNGELWALAIALSLPIGYGIYDYVVRKEKNWMSLLGVVNTLFTGGFALFNLEGHWFSIKEAFFPLLIGVAVLASNWLARPFMKTLFWTPQVLDLEKIEGLVDDVSSQHQLNKIFRTTTYLFAISFFISAALNFFIARNIFVPIDPTLPPTEASAILNEQIAQMTWKGYVMIALPMVAFMAGILWHFMSALKKLTGLKVEELMATGHHSPSK